MTAWVQSAEGIKSLGGVLLALSTITVGLRLLARHYQQTYLGKDDFLMLAGYITYIGVVASLFVGVAGGYIGYAKYSGLTETVDKTYIANDMLVAASFGFVKLSVLFFYQRVFCIPGRWDIFRIITTFFVVITSLWTIAYFILPPLQCGPHLSDLWQPKKTEFCRIGYIWTLSQSSSDLILEVSLLLIPLPKIYSLHMSLKRKLGITVVFLASFVSVGASVARLVIFVNTEKLQAVNRVSSPLLSNTSLLFMNAFEAGMTIIAANLPSLFFLRNMVSPENVARSIRSMLSLSSLTSRSSEKATTKVSSGSENTETLPSNCINGVASQRLPSVTYGLVPENKVARTAATAYHEAETDHHNPNQGVHVRSEFSQSVENV